MTGHLPLDADSRFAVQDCLGRYIWALDVGDIDAVLSEFTPTGCVFVDTRGNRHEGRDGIRKSFTALIGDPDFRGRQHIVTHLFADRIGDEVELRSYWVVVKWSFAQNRKEVFSTGHSRDVLTKVDGAWRIRERHLGWFTDQHAPWVGLS